MEQPRNVYRAFMGKPGGKKPLGRPRHRWEDNIKMNLREMGCDPGDWKYLADVKSCGRWVVKLGTGYTLLMLRGQLQAYMREIMSIN